MVVIHCDCHDHRCHDIDMMVHTNHLRWAQDPGTRSATLGFKPVSFPPVTITWLSSPWSWSSCQCSPRDGCQCAWSAPQRWCRNHPRPRRLLNPDLRSSSSCSAPMMMTNLIMVAMMMMLMLTTCLVPIQVAMLDEQLTHSYVLSSQGSCSCSTRSRWLAGSRTSWWSLVLMSDLGMPTQSQNIHIFLITLIRIQNHVDISTSLWSLWLQITLRHDCFFHSSITLTSHHFDHFDLSSP